MPTQRPRLTKTEDQEYRNRLSHLEKMGILVGSAVNAPHEPDRLLLEETEYEIASIYELPLTEVAVVVPAKMTILKSGTLITQVAMMTPWDEEPLDLCDPDDGSYYVDLIGRLYHSPPTVLNRLLITRVPLRPSQVEGVIIAHGYLSVPRQYHDESLVTMKLLLMDVRRNEMSFDFGVRVDRSVIRKCERQRRERLECAQFKRSGLHEPEGKLPQEESIPRQEDIQGAIKEQDVGGEHAASPSARTRKLRDVIVPSDRWSGPG